MRWTAQYVLGPRVAEEICEIGVPPRELPDLGYAVGSRDPAGEVLADPRSVEPLVGSGLDDVGVGWGSVGHGGSG
jgi:hypothetical protein